MLSYMAATKAKRPRGASTKFVEERRKHFLQATSLGVPHKQACMAAGWSEGSAYNYLSEGRAARILAERGDKLTQRQQEAREFLDQVEAQTARGLQAALGCVLQNVQRGDWRAAAWWVEHKFPDEFGRNTKVDFNGTLQVEVSASDLLQQLARVTGDVIDVEEVTTNGALPAAQG